MFTQQSRHKSQSLTYQTAQASLEYFILFTIIAVITIISFSALSGPGSLLHNVWESIQGIDRQADGSFLKAKNDGFFQKAATEITK